MRTLPITLALILVGTPATAQWLNEPTVGIPRLAGGAPNLSAAPPRAPDGKPDFSGLWSLGLHPGYVANIAADLGPEDVQPWAADLFSQRMADLGKDDPGTIGCLPLGPRHITGGGLVSRVKIVQTPTLIVFLYEDLAYRQVFIDGRQLPNDPHPSFMGYSVGRWDGDELVVESVGFNEGTWLDFGGHPHTDSLRMTERYRRLNFGHVQRQITLEDPRTFTQPITIAAEMTFLADTDLLEYVCAETPRERFRLTGRSADERTVRISPETMARYVGVYEVQESNVFGIRTLNVSLSGSQLFMDFNGKGRMPLMPLSATMFSPRLLGTYEFVTDAAGEVTHVLVHGIEGTNKAVRSR